MSALPFLTPMPAAQSGAALDQSSAGANPASTLTHSEAGDQLVKPITSSESASGELAEGEGNQSFWNTLRKYL